MISQELQQQVVCLTDEAGFVRLPPRCELVLRGGDRSKFLNNFCTADIEKLENGFVTELFILDTRGKTLAFGHVAKLDEDIFISTAAAEQSNELLQHLDKYIIREDVSIENRTDAIASFFISGKQHPNLLDPNFTIVQNQIRSIEKNEGLFGYLER